MLESIINPEKKRLQHLIMLAATFTLLIVGLFSATNFLAYRYITESLPNLLRMGDLQVPMLVLDEALSMSARLSTATGDPEWEARYHRLEPQLDQAFREALQLSMEPAFIQAVMQSDAANKKRVVMENRAFELVRQGRQVQAHELLSSEAYQAQKGVYAAGMAEVGRLLKQDIDAVRERRRVRLLLSLAIAAILIPLLMLGWWLVLRAVRQWQAAVVESNRQSNQKAAELTELNSQLDTKVSERTKELNESVLASLNMMEDAVQQRERAEESIKKLYYLAYYDVLTGLANRVLFHERLEQSVKSATERGGKLALVLLDIERFKAINDTVGRSMGDALLKDAAGRMSRYAVDVDRLGRLYADHFGVIVHDVPSEHEMGLLLEQRVAEVFGPSFRIGEFELRMSAKFGIAMFPADGTDADTLLRNAEVALKRAKAIGQRYLFYAQSMNSHVAEKLALESKLREALEKEQFVLHYQPKVSLASGKVTGAEALIRWNDPHMGLVPPGNFIPILEETGLIYEVGRWALHQAVADYLRWRTAGLPAVRIAVNVSPLQLRNRGFVAEVESVVRNDALAAAGLELELTESLIMEDVNLSIARLKEIRDLGVSIAIDDFGTGFSSLSYLAKLPLNTLKIDRSFVSDMTGTPEGLALVSTIITLAHSIKLKVVAEGVETEEQSRLLRLLSCDEIQGYLFSKPVPREIFEARFLAPPLAA